MAENAEGSRSAGEMDRRQDNQGSMEYRPPTVERLGSLRDLLGKSGSNPDTGFPTKK